MKRPASINMAIVQQLIQAPHPGEALRRFRSWGSPILFESSSQRAHLGRYSFLTADPIRRIELQRVSYGVDPLLELERELEKYRQVRIEGLPPFQGGAAGLLGFELGGAWERLPRNGRDAFQLPDLAVGIYDWVLAWDHELDRAWIIAQGLTEGMANEDAAQCRVENVREALRGGEEGQESPAGLAVNPHDLLIVPTSIEGVYSDFSRREYLDRVQRVIDYIHAGDVFQVNLSQRLLSRAEDSSVDLYQRLRRINPAPFSGYFSWSGADAKEEWSIVSASPERFMAVRGERSGDEADQGDPAAESASGGRLVREGRIAGERQGSGGEHDDRGFVAERSLASLSARFDPRAAVLRRGDVPDRATSGE